MSGNEIRQLEALGERIGAELAWEIQRRVQLEHALRLIADAEKASAAKLRKIAAEALEAS